MAYQFPLNGGRINASIGGNSTSAGAGYSLISTGNMLLAGGNNITLSQNGQSVSIVGGAAGGAAVSAVGNSISSGTAIFSNSNGVSFGMAGSTITASHNGITSQTNQTIGGYATGNTTGQSSSSTFDARSMSMSGVGGVSLGYSGSMLQVSGPAVSSLSQTGIISISRNGNTISIGAPAFSAGMSTLGNTAGTAGTASNQIIFAGGNNVTLSQSTGVSGNTISFAAGGGIALANSQTTYGTGTASILEGAGAITIGSGTGQRFNITVPNASSISATGAVSISTSGNTISIGAPVQSNQAMGFYGTGNTTQNSSTQLDARSLTFNGLGGVSVGYSNGSIQISGAAGGGGGIALANSQTTFSSGTANLNASGAMTIASTTGQQLNFSVPATSSLSATGGISISTNGGTISIGAPTPGTLSRWEYPTEGFTSLGSIGQGSLSIEHMYVPFYVTGSAMKIGGSISAATNTSVTTASANMSLWMGIYTLNGSTLSLASSGSANNGFAWSVSNSSTANSSVNSMRQMTVPMNVNMTPGEYWVAAAISSATTYTSAGFTMYGNAALASAATGAVLTPIGSDTTNARDAMLFQGIYVAQTAAGPTTIVGSQINNTSASNVQRANFYNVIYNATY